MKKYRIIFPAFALALLFCSCGDWLEVRSDTRATEKEIFSTPGGFHTAVNGVYRLLSHQNLYGRNLSYGALSILGNNYQENRLPTSYYYLATGDYEATQSKSIITAMWESGYEAIANCNNIIQNARDKQDGFFPAGKTEKDMIIGEMLGVRAHMHLDLLRLFAPIPSLAGSIKYIPYQDYYPGREPIHLTVAEVLERIVTDLEEARALLRQADTEQNTAAINTFDVRMDPSFATSPMGGEFFTLRGIRMNYFAVTGLLARAYQWKGDGENAFLTAQELYDFNEENGWFDYTAPALVELQEDRRYRKIPHDILLGYYNLGLFYMVEELSTSPGIFLKNKDHLFAEWSDDFRSSRLITSDLKPLRWLYTENEQIYRNQGALIPVIRMSEMAYIMCEHLVTEGEVEETVAILNKLRLARGIKASLNPAALDAETLAGILRNEMTREFLSEGHTFFMYKRLNQPIYNGEVAMDMTDRYVLPRPESETGYLMN